MLVCRSYSLPVKDRGGRTWEFVIKSWANGTENRRVYVLEQTGEYLKVIIFVLPTLAVPRLYALLCAWHFWQVVKRCIETVQCAVQPCCCLRLSPSERWEPVPLVCVMLQLACIQLSDTYTGSLSYCCSWQCSIGMHSGYTP